MTMQNDIRNRLVELLIEGHKKYLYYDQIADYLLENGVIVPPYKVGDTGFEIRAKGKRHSLRGVRKCDYGIETNDGLENAIAQGLEMYVKEKAFVKSDMARLNITVFLTKEDAEQKLKEMKVSE